jgi:hypothetical protein
MVFMSVTLAEARGWKRVFHRSGGTKGAQIFQNQPESGGVVIRAAEVSSPAFLISAGQVPERVR